ncbi:MAG: YfcE family phosphodiesterase, partial [Candidatus Helarchaeota archaeon]
LKVSRMRVLVIGDFHYPDRANYPSDIFEYLKGEIFDVVLCTGDLTDPKILEELEKFGKVKIVQGNMDWRVRHADKHILRIKNLRIGLIHGHQVRPRGDINKLYKLAKNLDVNILISGHTHAQSIIKKDNIILINPGSATGAWSFVADGIPSFVIMEINEKIKISRYKLINNEFQCRINEFKKENLI